MKHLKIFLLALLLIAGGDRLSPAQVVPTTAPIKFGATLPATCVPNSKDRVLFYKTGTSNGLYQCSAVNTWSATGGSSTDAAAVHKTGDETITSGVKTFSVSPIVPTPTTDFQAAPKGYVDAFNGRLRVLEFDGTPQSVDFGYFYPADTPLGDCFYETWIKGLVTGFSGKYDWSEGYGGFHAMLRNPANGNVFRGAVVTGATNASPIVVTTSLPHGFVTGDVLYSISGVLGNTAANGSNRTITVLSPTTFSINSSVGNGAYTSGGVIYGNLVSFGADDEPYAGQWAHSATGVSDGLIVQYYDGVPVGQTAFAGQRIMPAGVGGNGHGFMGGSDHSNLHARIAQYRIFEGSNPNAVYLANNNLNAFVPETVFGGFADNNGLGLKTPQLLVDFYDIQQIIQDKSSGYPQGKIHPGKIRGTGASVTSNLSSYPGPQYVTDADVPNALGLTQTPQPAGKAYTPLTVPMNALVFDSFQRKNSTYAFDGRAGLGSTEGGSLGALAYSERDMTSSGIPVSFKQFGILNEKAFLYGSSANFSRVAIAQTNLDVRVSRTTSDVWGMGISTGLMFRYVDDSNFCIAYTTGTTRANQVLIVEKYIAGANSFMTGTGGTTVAMPASWTTLRVLTKSDGTWSAYADATLVASGTDASLASGTGAGVGHGYSAGQGLAMRYRNFTVYTNP